MIGTGGGIDLDRLAEEAFAAGDLARAQRLYRQLAASDPSGNLQAISRQGVIARRLGHFQAALRLLTRTSALQGQMPRLPARSAIIPVLDGSPHSPYNIETLLTDLADFDGEVVCVFNDAAMHEKLASHPRIDKRALNSQNVGVGRAWNIGINLAEGAVLFVLNADLHVGAPAWRGLESQLLSLPDALAVGVAGDHLDWQALASRHAVDQSMALPMQVDMLSGFFFALHAERLHAAGISFDPRLAPCFYEEMDLALKARAAGLKLYVAAASPWIHHWGVSRNPTPLRYFGRAVDRALVLARNAALLEERRDRLLRETAPRVGPQR